MTLSQKEGAPVQPQFCWQGGTPGTSPVPALSGCNLPATPLLWLVPSSSTGCSASGENIYSAKTIRHCTRSHPGVQKPQQINPAVMPRSILSRSLSGPTGSRAGRGDKKPQTKQVFRAVLLTCCFPSPLPPSPCGAANLC